LLLYLLLASCGGWRLAAQIRTPLPVPGFSGYRTLKAEFHIHTIFSDGLVWPTVRVSEAWRDGLDVISLTDHLEYQPHKAFVKVEHGRSHQVAKPLADELGIILVPGVEITKRYPAHPAHFNALFVTDAAAILADDLHESLRRARAQGAFAFWNHPGWSVAKAEWFAPIAKAYDEKLFQGMELGNQNHFYAEAYPWLEEKKLAALATGDWHDPVEPRESAGIRPITLLFVKTADLAGVRDALFARRTAAWMNGQVWGSEEHLRGLWEGAVRVENASVTARPGAVINFRLRNSSAFNFQYRPRHDPSVMRMDDGGIPPESLSLWKPVLGGIPAGTHRIEMELEITNFHIGPGRNLVVRVPVSVTVP
jgi:3',5'-nucleoside bisphosphate phosphatase